MEKAQQTSGSPLRSALFGFLTALIVWLPLMLPDCIDEFLRHGGSLCSLLTYPVIPVVLAVFYIRHHKNANPPRRNLAAWLLSYTAAFSLSWYLVRREIDVYYIGVLIPQHVLGDGVKINGIEYVMYGFPAMVIFLAIVIAYHIWEAI